MDEQQSAENVRQLSQKISPALLMRFELMVQTRARQAITGFQGGQWYWASADFPALILDEDRETTIFTSFHSVSCQVETACWGICLIMLSGLIGPEGSAVEVQMYEALYEAAIERATARGEHEVGALMDIID